MDKTEAFNKSEQYFFELQKTAADKYAKEIQEAYAKAHNMYVELMKEVYETKHRLGKDR